MHCSLAWKKIFSSCENLFRVGDLWVKKYMFTTASIEKCSNHFRSRHKSRRWRCTLDITANNGNYASPDFLGLKNPIGKSLYKNVYSKSLWRVFIFYLLLGLSPGNGRLQASTRSPSLQSTLSQFVRVHSQVKIQILCSTLNFTYVVYSTIQIVNMIGQQCFER